MGHPRIARLTAPRPRRLDCRREPVQNRLGMLPRSFDQRLRTGCASCLHSERMEEGFMANKS
jgi:hypothetical protein